MTRALGLTVALLVLALGGRGLSEAEKDEVIVNINHSRFEPEAFEFEAGDEVRFVIHNGDPIDHEFILGDALVQSRHERGVHTKHDSIPGEVSVPAGATAITTYEFHQPGELIIGCHVPAHYEYGMKARVTVEA
jgi:uncharacterized cupredoxin-like copper-binding protein